jgi:transcription initiation factor TFIID subunit TAF12
MSEDGAPPVFLESNKPEAERCVEMAAAAWKTGDLARAERMLSKSLRLYPTVQAQRLIAELNADIERQTVREQARQEHQRQAAQEAAQERARQERQREQQQQHQQQHHHQQQQHHQSRPQQRPAAATPPKSASAPPPSTPATAGANYTAEQSESARLIITKAKDYYAIFSVKRTATESEIKSSYRKLALKFVRHNGTAPG